MKCLGLIGTHSADANAHHLRRIIDEFRHRFGVEHAANVIALSLHTPAFAQPNSQAAVEKLASAAGSLNALGAEAVMICSSVLQVAAAKSAAANLLPSMAEVTAASLRKARIKRVGLIGTQREDEERFWRRQLSRAQVLDVFLPTTRDRELLGKIVTTELDRGIVNESSRADLVRIVYSLRQAGARAVVLATPALLAPLLGAPPVLSLFDAAELNVLAAVEWAAATQI